MYSCAFVMILNSDENRILAESVLSTIIRIINDHVLSLEQRIAEVRYYVQYSHNLKYII